MCGVCTCVMCVHVCMETVYSMACVCIIRCGMCYCDLGCQGDSYWYSEMSHIECV